MFPQTNKDPANKRNEIKTRKRMFQKKKFFNGMYTFFFFSNLLSLYKKAKEKN